MTVQSRAEHHGGEAQRLRAKKSPGVKKLDEPTLLVANFFPKSIG